VPGHDVETLNYIIDTNRHILSHYRIILTQ
jgi:hypothetical protein